MVTDGRIAEDGWSLFDIGETRFNDAAIAEAGVFCIHFLMAPDLVHSLTVSAHRHRHHL